MFLLSVQKLNEDICSLSTLCAKTNQSETIPKDELLVAPQRTQSESGQITEAKVNSIIRSIQKEVNFEKSFKKLLLKKYTNKVHQLFQVPNESESTNIVPNDAERTKLNGHEPNSNSQNGTGVVRCQHDTITKAIEVNVLAFYS